MMTKITQEKVDKFMFYFSIIDIMFFPYIWSYLLITHLYYLVFGA